MITHPRPVANSLPAARPMPDPDDLIGRDPLAARVGRVPDLLTAFPPYRTWDVYADPDTPGVVLLASPRAAGS